MGFYNGLDMGRKLISGSWNAELYGRLESLRAEGVEQGTDARFQKSKPSPFLGAVATTNC